MTRSRTSRPKKATTLLSIGRTTLCIVLAGEPTIAGPTQGEQAPRRPWEEVCKEATAQPLSAARLTGPLTTAELAKCDGQALYYGFAAPPNYAAALQCGWGQRDLPERADNNRDMFFGPGVLTMLYANGHGVPRDYDLAIRFACEQEWAAPAETERRVLHLSELKESTETSEHFDLCDDITSGLSMGVCAAVSERAKTAERSRELATIASAFSPAQMRRHEDLMAAEEDFNEMRVRSEIDLSGTARAMLIHADLGRLRDQFLINLKHLSKDDLPQTAPGEAKELDTQMNALYQRIMRAPDSAFEQGTVKREGVRASQRAWIPMRDAWVAFAKVTYPHTSPDRVAAQLIRLRLNQLRHLPVDLK